jgi:hypothetical protein
MSTILCGIFQEFFIPIMENLEGNMDHFVLFKFSFCSIVGPSILWIKIYITLVFIGYTASNLYEDLKDEDSQSKNEDSQSELEKGISKVSHYKFM